MSEMNPILDKKLGGYNTNDLNFVAPGEITVTITLSEYRDLVSKEATAKERIDAANKDKFSRDAEIKDVKDQNNALRAENYELKKRIDELHEVLNEADAKIADLESRVPTYPKSDATIDIKEPVF